MSALGDLAVASGTGHSPSPYGFGQQDNRRRFKGIALVVVVHVLAGYVLVSGLAREGITLIKKPLEAVLLQEVIIPPPPPPHPPPPPKKSNLHLKCPRCRRHLSRLPLPLLWCSRPRLLSHRRHHLHLLRPWCLRQRQCHPSWRHPRRRPWWQHRPHLRRLCHLRSQKPMAARCSRHPRRRPRRCSTHPHHHPRLQLQRHRYRRLLLKHRRRQ